jgi:hypothetical protein
LHPSFGGLRAGTARRRVGLGPTYNSNNLKNLICLAAGGMTAGR